MNKLSSTNVFVLFVATVLVVGGFLVGYTRLLVGVPGRYLAADLSAADLSGIASKYPTFIWGALIIMIIFCIGYGIYYLVSRNKKPA